MSEAAESAPAKKKLHNPLHVTIMVVLVTGLCAFLLHNGTEQKFVFGILLAVTHPRAARRRYRPVIGHLARDH